MMRLHQQTITFTWDTDPLPNGDPRPYITAGHDLSTAYGHDLHVVEAGEPSFVAPTMENGDRFNFVCSGQNCRAIALDERVVYYNKFNETINFVCRSAAERNFADGYWIIAER